MSTRTTAEDIRSGLPTQELPIVRRRPKLPWAIIGLATIIVAAVIAAVALANAQHARELDGQARDAIISQLVHDAEKQFDGGIVVTNFSSSYRYGWDSSARTMSVKLTLGYCDGIEGYFANVPTRPNSAMGISALTIKDVPSVSSGVPQKANVPLDAPNRYQLLAASGYSHCITGDMRLVPSVVE